MPNYIWVINKFIANYGATYIRFSTVCNQVTVSWYFISNEIILNTCALVGGVYVAIYIVLL